MVKSNKEESPFGVSTPLIYFKYGKDFDSMFSSYILVSGACKCNHSIIIQYSIFENVISLEE